MFSSAIHPETNRDIPHNRLRSTGDHPFTLRVGQVCPEPASLHRYIESIAARSLPPATRLAGHRMNRATQNASLWSPTHRNCAALS